MLMASDLSKSIEFRLAKPSGKDHEGWLTYQIILANDHDKQFVFPVNPKDLVFLDTYAEEEVTLLCNGIRHVVSQGGEFDFQPVDEEDFRLVVSVSGSLAEVRLTFPDTTAPADVHWAQGVMVENSELIKFANDLERQYRELVALVSPD